MTCRHSATDPSCSRNDPYKYASPSYSDTPDASKYEIVDAARVGSHLILKVKYPNCRMCAFEGQKVMVFLNVTEMEVLRWKKIDPHFRASVQASPAFKPKAILSEAPSPAARFPSTPEGWADALAYAQGKK